MTMIVITAVVLLVGALVVINVLAAGAGVELIYRANSRGIGTWAVVGKCPRCGDEVQTRTVATLDKASELLRDWPLVEPTTSHRCGWTQKGEPGNMV